MSQKSANLLSIVVPVFNEAPGLAAFHRSLADQLEKLEDYEFEVIYCNDGSHDDSLAVLQQLAESDARIRVISLTRNFGKELATTAGLQQAHGAAIVTIDADGQHPVELLPQFIDKWRAGSLVVVGLSANKRRVGWLKRLGSRAFYSLINSLTGIPLLADATDYRLIDRQVQQEFLGLTEHNRITRGLIDWLGYEQTYIRFTAHARQYGKAGYSVQKLTRLAVDSLISLSSSPLYITAYIGAVVLPVSVLLALVMVVNAVVGDPLQWHATGGAYVLVFVLCLIGILMLSQGIIGLYLSHIHSETQNRPLFVIDREASKRL